MELSSVDVQHKRFRTRWRGFDPQEVESFVQQLAEEMQSAKTESATLRITLQEMEKELKDYKEREKSIRNVLLNVQKTAEQMKTNAEKEARLIVAEAELKAEKILQSAHQRLGQLHEDIGELKRHRIQLVSKLRYTIETYRQLLDMDNEEEKDTEPGSKVKVLNR
ncbi:MAG: DivIVA domain-containing protein [Deltaproteobacteria bacterium]|jgi:cell division initiation protein|nr:DivIVA domain-containing protein [Deltaproteobacteria bacterium]